MISGYVESFERLKEAAAEAARAIAEAMCAMAESLRPIWTLFYDREKTAMYWAGLYHPEWVAIYNRTKKARIRKKYYDRIMRGYAAEIEKEVTK